MALNDPRSATVSGASSAGLLCAILAILLCGSPAVADEDPHADARARMVETIKDHALFSADALGPDGLAPRVTEVMAQVPRHEFLPKGRTSARNLISRLLPGYGFTHEAYADRPVPIGFGQTMSQPFIVALMTDLLDPAPGHVVLEVGTGSGYQAAVLAHLVDRVCTIEIVPELGASAAATLERLGYGNVETRVGDGYYGWEDCGPFDGIVVTAVASHVPPPLLAQLKPGGRMVIPVGGAFSAQQLIEVVKHSDGQVSTRQLLPVRFVPLTREAP